MITFWIVTILASAQFAKSAMCPGGCDCSNRTVMECTGKGLNSMPKQISQNVSEFLANDNNITELPTRMLMNAKSLLTLSLRRNKIERLRPNNFKNSDSLKHLDLSHNNISKIQGRAFFGLRQLRRLNLEGNKILWISSRAFEYADSLRELSLSDNKLNGISKKLLERQTRLEVLKLDGNRIKTVYNDMFRSQSSLRILDLSNNRIQRISFNAFRRLNVLEELRLQHNQLTEFDVGLTDNLKTRCLGKDNVSSTAAPSGAAGRILPEMTELRILDISNNYLKIVAYESFQHLYGLQSLILKNNHWRCDCALRLSVQSFPTRLRQTIWNGVVCHEPDNVAGLPISDLFLSEEPNITDPAPLHVSDSTILFKDSIATSPPNAISSDVTPTTSTITRREGRSGGNSNGMRRTTSSDSISAMDRATSLRSVPLTVIKDIEHERDLTNSNATDISKRTKPDKWWVVTAISAAIFISICCLVFGINKFMNKSHRSGRIRRKRSGDNTSFRTSSSNSRFYDYQFSGRPLPRAPNAIERPLGRNTPDEVRLPNVGRCGSERSSFISMRTYSNTSNAKGSYHSSALDGRYQRARKRSSTNASIDTTETKATDTNSSHRVKLPPLPCAISSTISTASEKPFTEVKSTETNRQVTSKEGERKRQTPRLGRQTDSAQPSSTRNTEPGGNPPPPPQRNETSKSRCRELLRKKKLLESQNRAEYCEVGASESEETADLGDNLLYKKYLQKMIDPNYNRESSRQASGIHTPIHTKHNPSDYSDHYDRLSYNVARRHFNAAGPLSNDTHNNCFNRAENDFVFSRPSEEEKLRRSSTGRMFALRKEQRNALQTRRDRKARMSVITPSPLSHDSTHCDVSLNPTTEHQIGFRAQSFSYGPRQPLNRLNKTTPTIVVQDPVNATANKQSPECHEYHQLRLMYSGTSEENKFTIPNEIPEGQTGHFKTGCPNTDCIPKSEDLKRNARLKYNSMNSEVSGNSSQAHASDKEEVEELKNLVQSILRSERGDSRPVSRSGSTKDHLTVAASQEYRKSMDSLHSDLSINGSCVATPAKTPFLNVASEIDLTESDDAGYLSPLTTLKKKDKVEEEEIFGEIQIHNRRAPGKIRKQISAQRKTRKSSSTSRNSNAENDYCDCYATSESDEQYDSIHRERRPKKSRRNPRNIVCRNSSDSSVYMSIIDNNNITTIPDPRRKQPISNRYEDSRELRINPLNTEAAFHSREREIYSNAMISEDCTENCYEEILPGQNSTRQQSNRGPEENYYQEVTKIPPKKRRNKKHKSRFAIGHDQSKKC